MNRETVKRVAQELQLLRSGQMDVRFHGLSMLPFLREGDRVVLEQVEWKDLAVGDLITYRCGDKYPTRRVVRTHASSLVLWCDNWPDLRYRIPREHLLGRVCARERDGVWVRRDDDEWRVATEWALAAYRARYARPAVAHLRKVAAQLRGWWHMAGS